jgi:hypothetical protein
MERSADRGRAATSSLTLLLTLGYVSDVYCKEDERNERAGERKRGRREKESRREREVAAVVLRY